jgi:hypothetical protein
MHHRLRTHIAKYLAAARMIPVIVANEGVFDRLVGHAADCFEQFPGMARMKCLEGRMHGRLARALSEA